VSSSFQSLQFPKIFGGCFLILDAEQLPFLMQQFAKSALRENRFEMKQILSYRITLTTCIGLVAFALLGGGQSKVYASCGDYLEHSVSKIVFHESFQPGSHLPSQNQTPLGTSCGNGQCRANFPIAPFEIRHDASILLDEKFQDPNENAWARMRDVSLPVLPCDEVLTPPPEAA
jgi:hypothetical protein